MIAAMGRLAKIKPQPKFALYRHFAIGTVALAGSIAMFADGEAQEVAGDARAELANLPNVQPSPMVVRKPKARLAQSAEFESGSWERDSSYGRPTDPGLRPDQSSRTDGALPSTLAISEPALRLSSLDGMTPAQREAAVSQSQSPRQRRKTRPSEPALSLPGQPPISNAGTNYQLAEHGDYQGE